jgi:hypothetical protein
MDIQPPSTNLYLEYECNCGSLPQPMNVIHGKVRLQMVLQGILIFIMIPSSGDDIIASAVVVGPY